MGIIILHIPKKYFDLGACYIYFFLKKIKPKILKQNKSIFCTGRIKVFSMVKYNYKIRIKPKKK